MASCHVFGHFPMQLSYSFNACTTAEATTWTWYPSFFINFLFWTMHVLCNAYHIKQTSMVVLFKVRIRPIVMHTTSFILCDEKHLYGRILVCILPLALQLWSVSQGSESNFQILAFEDSISRHLKVFATISLHNNKVPFGL